MIDFIRKANEALLADGCKGCINKEQYGYSIFILNQYLVDGEFKERLKTFQRTLDYAVTPDGKEWFVPYNKNAGVRLIEESNLYLACLQLAHKAGGEEKIAN